MYKQKVMLSVVIAALGVIVGFILWRAVVGVGSGGSLVSVKAPSVEQILNQYNSNSQLTVSAYGEMTSASKLQETDGLLLKLGGRSISVIISSDVMTLDVSIALSNTGERDKILGMVSVLLRSIWELQGLDISSQAVFHNTILVADLSVYTVEKNGFAISNLTGTGSEGVSVIVDLARKNSLEL